MVKYKQHIYLNKHTSTRSVQTSMPKGGSLMEQDMVKVPRKTLQASQPVLSNDFALMRGGVGGGSLFLYSEK